MPTAKGLITLKVDLVAINASLSIKHAFAGMLFFQTIIQHKKWLAMWICSIST